MVNEKDIKKISENLTDIADLVKMAIEFVTDRTDIGFTLIVYTEDQAQYISNVEREHSRKAIGNLMAHWDSESEDIPLHEQGEEIHGKDN